MVPTLPNPIIGQRAPVRIQRKRVKGWRMPKNAVYVGRPTCWGNPYTAQAANEAGYREGRGMALYAFRQWLLGETSFDQYQQRRRDLLHALPMLRGKDLACWCPLDQLCHADVLLELANQ